MSASINASSVDLSCFTNRKQLSKAEQGLHYITIRNRRSRAIVEVQAASKAYAGRFKIGGATSFIMIGYNGVGISLNPGGRWSRHLQSIAPLAPDESKSTGNDTIITNLEFRDSNQVVAGTPPSRKEDYTISYTIDFV